MPPLSGEDRLVISVDFGTTFSGVSYAFSYDKDTVEVINEWPGSRNSTRDKVPTEILYTAPDPVSGVVLPGRDGKRSYEWGYGISFQGRRNAEPLKWFKLLLHDRNPFSNSGIYGKGNIDANTRDLPEWAFNLNDLVSQFSALTLPPQNLPGEKQEDRITKDTPVAKTAIQLARFKLPPVDVVTDYLRALREHTLSVIETRFGVEFIRRTKTEYMLTVPAVWSDSAKALTMKAAKNAGFGEHETDFNLIGEPEAAAAYSLHAIQPSILKIGDTFVVCDAGGGTVDLVSYKIDRLNPLAVSEVVAGSGGLCGSVFVNEMFEEHIRKLLGNNTINNMKPVAKREMMRQWEDKVKFTFADAGNVEYFDVYIPGVPDDEEKGLEAGFLSLSRKDVKNIFDPVIDRIVALVAEQILKVRNKGANVSAVLLVGGFGASEYLEKRLSEQKFFGGKVQVMRPMNAWTAITRGALIRGLDGSFVRDQIARRHYGVGFREEYVAGKRGKEKYRTWDSTQEKWMVPNQINWTIDKGMVLEEGKTFSISLYRTVCEDTSRIFFDDLRACNTDKRPSWDNPNFCYTVCTLTYDLSRLPMETFEQHVNSSGVRYWKVQFSLEMKVSSGMITFSMQFEGKNYGSVEATFT
ncbi:hypothetical protein RUND412_000411 [Rhizina undulata]